MCRKFISIFGENRASRCQHLLHWKVILYVIHWTLRCGFYHIPPSVRRSAVRRTRPCVTVDIATWEECPRTPSESASLENAKILRIAVTKCFGIYSGLLRKFPTIFVTDSPWNGSTQRVLFKWQVCCVRVPMTTMTAFCNLRWLNQIPFMAISVELGARLFSAILLRWWRGHLQYLRLPLSRVSRRSIIYLYAYTQKNHVNCDCYGARQRQQPMCIQHTYAGWYALCICMRYDYDFHWCLHDSNNSAVYSHICIPHKQLFDAKFCVR